MESLRHNKQRTDWVFTSATNALNTDQALKPEDKQLLKRMIAAMTDPNEALPPADF